MNSEYPALGLRNVEAGYGKMDVLFGVVLRVDRGQIAALVGSNGAGKTTTLRTIVGQVRCRSGTVHFMGDDISHELPYVLTRKGIAMCPEGRSILGNLSVLENLRLGAYVVRDKKAYMEQLEKVYAMFPRLRDRRSQNSASLSGGEQQMLAVGRALMSFPKLLLLDEPSLGLAPNLARDIFKSFETIRREGSSILVVEQNVSLSLKVADYAYVMERGKISLEGLPKALLDNQHVRDSYLGVA
jgi:branched-chain amino acid transport system ATP-binding protein